jgi:hypothetical protein
MIEERFRKKLSSWKGKLLSVGGWLVLISVDKLIHVYAFLL